MYIYKKVVITLIDLQPSEIVKLKYFHTIYNSN